MKIQIALFCFSFLGFFAQAEQKFEKKNILVGNQKIKVEIAVTPEQLSQGLMNREKMGEDEGMLFIFPTERTLSFWMKNTLIPLSIGFFDKNKTLVDVQEMVPVAIMQVDLPHYESKKPAMYALEMNKGWFQRRGLKPGVKFQLLEK